jgi:hypothetical protein
MLDLNTLTRDQSQALEAADDLFAALDHLNDTSGSAFASGKADSPLGAVETALKITLVAALGDDLGTLLYDLTIEAYEYPRSLLHSLV